MFIFLYIFMMLVGAVIFYCGFELGKANRQINEEKEQYIKLYGTTSNRLMQPVRRGVKRDER